MISVAMIAMNEERAVARVLGDIAAAMGGREFEIVLVDSSSDNTAWIAERMGARVIRQLPPEGYGRAMARALHECRGEVIVTMDCDGTYPAHQIVPIAAMVLKGECDLVNASRLRRRPAAMPWPNYIANRVFAWIARLMLGVKCTDLHSGMRAYSSQIIERVPVDPNGPALPVELLLKPALMGFRIREIFIPYAERIGNTTLQRWSSTVWTLRRIFRLSFKPQPRLPSTTPAD